MFYNATEIEMMARSRHDCPNVRKAVRLLMYLVRAVNQQSDGWAYWSPPQRSCRKLFELLSTVGNMQYNTHRTITDQQLKLAVAPIRRMVTVQKKKQAKFGNSFDFDVDSALE